MNRKIAIISDVHGNSHALKSVLKDIARRKAEMIINLGDSVYGPLEIIEQISVPYNWEEAAELAVQQERYDWAQALKTGKIE
ncbi:metallophosphoesterase [Bacillus sp. SH5-2]|uniref:metallophosphoesterase family protein n=1 Tax=Bacillus sp. SH5-2 TaxID=2217834 RepID=UPI0011EF577C|nr:metallophosphoesterase [Bacillus sp. SH5-2]KAA0760545.1 hypothetical protein DN410_26225 [Bacillus sp. SH5-2]